MLEVLSALEMWEGMRRVLLCMLETVEGELCWLEVSEVPEAPEVMRCVLLCMLEAVEGRLWAQFPSFEISFSSYSPPPKRLVIDPCFTLLLSFPLSSCRISSLHDTTLCGW